MTLFSCVLTALAVHVNGRMQYVHYCGVLSASALKFNGSSTVMVQLRFVHLWEHPRLSCAFLRGYVGAVRTGPLRPRLSPPGAPGPELPAAAHPRGEGRDRPPKAGAPSGLEGPSAAQAADV